MLRKEQEEEARLAERLHEQRLDLERVEQLYMEKSRRLHELKAFQEQNQHGNPAETMLKMLRHETERNKDIEARLQR